MLILNQKTLSIFLLILFIIPAIAFGDCEIEQKQDAWTNLQALNDKGCSNQLKTEIVLKLQTEGLEAKAGWSRLLEQSVAYKNSLPTDSKMQEVFRQLVDRLKAASEDVKSPASAVTAWQILWRPGKVAAIDENNKAISLKSAIEQSCENEKQASPTSASTADTPTSKKSANCLTTIENGESFIEFVNAATGIAKYEAEPRITRLSSYIANVNQQWDRFLFHSKPMYPQDLWFTDLLTKSSRKAKKGLRAPPNNQFFILHPAPGFSYLKDADQGSRLKPSVYLEVLGYNRWQANYLTGVSYIIERADRANTDNIAHRGILLTFANKYQFGVTHYKFNQTSGYGITIGIDLASLYTSRLKPYADTLKLGQ